VATSSPVVVDRGFRALGEYKGRFYISASDYRGVGVVLESSNPAEGNNSFRQISPPGMLVWDMAIFNDMLYLGLENQKRLPGGKNRRYRRASIRVRHGRD
jgi:hypothetical protein